MAIPVVPLIYGNLVQVTTTPWELNLHIHRGIVPPSVPVGTTLNLLEVSELQGIVTIPLAVAKDLAKILQTVLDRASSQEGISEGAKHAKL